MINNDMTPANAIIAPLSLLQEITPPAAGALIILINALDPSDADRDSIDQALVRFEGSHPKQVATIRHELFRKFRH